MTSDARGRPLRDLRISVTDRCNFRCAYCMPKEVFGRDFPFLPRAALLTFEEIERIARVAVDLGVSKIRLTGGEPLLRRDIETLVTRLRAIDGLQDLTMTTNGALLARKAEGLAAAGLDRITVSLDSLHQTTFAAMNGAGGEVAQVLRGIDAAARAGLRPVKVNMVVQRGVNDTQIVDMASRFRGTGHTIRFIEFMDVGETNGWNMGGVVPSAEVVARIDAVWPLETLDPTYPGEVASRYRYRDGQGEIGVISSVTQPFCGACTRARLSAEGMLYTCLFAGSGHDVRAAVRSGEDDERLRALLQKVWVGRRDRYSELRGDARSRGRRVEMSYIGG